MVDEIELCDVRTEDFASFVEMMRDEPSARMAAFGSRNDDPAALQKRWLQARGRGVQKTILWRGVKAGFVSTFEMHGEMHVTYWVERPLWGRGIATHGLEALLRVVDVRPLHASTWAGNRGSQRVLEKCGFVRTHEARAFADARGEDVTEVFFELRAAERG